jgi:hypothetical protein
VDQPSESISERGRERVFLWLSALILIVACAAPVRLARVPWPFVDESESAAWTTFPVLLASIPAALLAELLVEVGAALAAGRVPRPGIFLRNATGVATSALPDPPDAVAPRVVERLDALGFTALTHTPVWPPGVLEIRSGKRADPLQQAFLDGKFAAVVTLAPLAGPLPEQTGTAAAATVTFLDTIVIDTGERERLRRTAEHLCLRDAELSVPTVPFIAYAGLMLTWAPLLWLTFAPPRGDAHEAQGLAVCLKGAAGFAAFSTLQILIKPKRLFGLRIVAITLVLSVAPYVARAVLTIGHK